MESLSLLIKPASRSCNMRCRYCFYADIADMREIKDHGIMSYGLLEVLVQKALSEATGHCAFGFQGGEPTLAGLDFFRKLIELEKKHNVNNVKISHALQTNGLLITEEWAELFRENKFMIGLSIDSAKKVHDDLRLDTTGKSTYNRCIQAAQLLTNHKVDFNILSVVTRHLAAHPDTAYHFYKQHNFRYIQLIPCLDGLNETHGTNSYSLSAKAYGRFLCRIFDLWYTDFLKNDRYSIRVFDNYIYMLAGHPPENCAMGGICSAYALVEADGSVYPCDFYAIDEFLLGNVSTHGFEEMLRGEKANAFIATSRYTDPSCLHCEYYFLCRGGCRRDREPICDDRLSSNYYCDAYKIFFQHALPRMETISRLF